MTGSIAHKFDGRRIYPCSEAEVFGEELQYSDDPTGALGYSKLDQYLGDELVAVWEKDDMFIVELVLDGSACRFIQIEGLPNYLEFVRLYLHPLVDLMSKGWRAKFVLETHQDGKVVPFPKG